MENRINQKIKVSFDFPFNNEIYTIINESKSNYEITGKCFIFKNGKKTSQIIDKSMVKEFLKED